MLLCAYLINVAHGKEKPAATASARDREIAARFAPIFYQGLGDHPRHDYITNFDFDGDWRGDNNWKNAADPRFPFKAYIYYAVSETVTHYFIHYAIFHPRDYKGGEARGPFLSEIIRQGVKRGSKYDPTGRLDDSVLAHENDMEGCLVVVLKDETHLSGAKVVYVETIAHNRFNTYTVTHDAPAEATTDARGLVTLEAGRPQLYIEPRGHGIFAYTSGEKQSPRAGLLAYRFTGRAGVAPVGEQTSNNVGYELTPLLTTIWAHARGGVNQTFGVAQNYGTLSVSIAQSNGKASSVRQVQAGTLGTAFRGSVGANNMARPPWGWFDRADAGESHGAWFFDPAATIKRHFNLPDAFSTAYTHAPFLGILRRMK